MFGYYLNLALRSLRRNAALTVLMIVAIGVGIGASMTTLTVLHILSVDALAGKSAQIFFPQVDPTPAILYNPHHPLNMMDYASAVDLWDAGRADRQTPVVQSPVKVSAPGSERPPLMLTMLATTADFFPMFEVPFEYGGGWTARTYLVRAQPRELSGVMVAARAAVARIAPNVVLDEEDSHTIAFLRGRFFQTDRAMAGLLVGVIVALLAVTAFGIVGLASFWVAQRRKQIGIRRALGATRMDILRYFQTENLLIVSSGIVIGIVLAIGINLALMKYFEAPRLPMWYLSIAVVVLWLLGQLAVLWPALRAAAVPAVVATRTV